MVANFATCEFNDKESVALVDGTVDVDSDPAWIRLLEHILKDMGNEGESSFFTLERIDIGRVVV